MARAALDKKADDLLILHVGPLVYYTEYLVICTGTSTQHVHTVVENVEHALGLHGLRPMGAEGLRGSGWVLLDYGDVILHAFTPETREYYSLDRLWLDADRVAPPAS